MAEDDREWVFESIAGYLSSPMWLTPINEFVETKSLGKNDGMSNVLLGLCTVSSAAELISREVARRISHR